MSVDVKLMLSWQVGSAAAAPCVHLPCLPHKTLLCTPVRTLCITCLPPLSLCLCARGAPVAGFKVFLEAGVDVVVLEVGLGGRLDATNCVRSPVVCGVSSLGFDHMELLGHTLPEIAREKAGIFKPAVPAFTVPQREDAAEALHQRAAAVGTSLSLVRPWQAIQGAADVTLGLAGEHQKLNAALAVALAGAWEGRSAAAAALQGARAAERAAAVAAGQLPPEYAAGLQAASWPGRGQIVHDAVAGAVTPLASPAAAGTNGTAAEEQQGQEAESEALPRLSFYLDGAHTAESMATCAHWFADAVGGPQQPAAAAGSAQAQPGGLVTQRVLLFNCMQVGAWVNASAAAAAAADAVLCGF